MIPADKKDQAEMGSSKSVVLTVRVEQKDLGEDYVSETVSAARLSMKNNKYFLTYQETDLEGGIIRSLIRAGQDQVEIIRHGAAESRMVLASGRKTAEMRATPAGPMRIETFTKEYSLVYEADALCVDVLYDLFLDGEFISLCRARIMAVPDKMMNRR